MGNCWSLLREAVRHFFAPVANFMRNFIQSDIKVGAFGISVSGGLLVPPVLWREFFGPFVTTLALSICLGIMTCSFYLLFRGLFSNRRFRGLFSNRRLFRGLFSNLTSKNVQDLRPERRHIEEDQDLRPERRHIEEDQDPPPKRRHIEEDCTFAEVELPSDDSYDSFILRLTYRVLRWLEVPIPRMSGSYSLRSMPGTSGYNVYQSSSEESITPTSRSVAVDVHRRRSSYSLRGEYAAETSFNMDSENTEKTYEGRGKESESGRYKPKKVSWASQLPSTSSPSSDNTTDPKMKPEPKQDISSDSQKSRVQGTKRKEPYTERTERTTSEKYADAPKSELGLRYRGRSASKYGTRSDRLLEFRPSVSEPQPPISSTGSKRGTDPSVEAENYQEYLRQRMSMSLAEIFNTSPPHSRRPEATEIPAIHRSPSAVSEPSTSSARPGESDDAMKTSAASSVSIDMPDTPKSSSFRKRLFSAAAEKSSEHSPQKRAKSAKSDDRVVPVAESSSSESSEED